MHARYRYYEDTRDPPVSFHARVHAPYPILIGCLSNGQRSMVNGKRSAVRNRLSLFYPNEEMRGTEGHIWMIKFI
jgi:hypothetical protein